MCATTVVWSNSCLPGPHPLIFIVQAKTQMLYFARDPLGRRSLLLSKPSEGHAQFVLGSVGEAGDNTQWGWEEVGCESIWQVRLEALVSCLCAMFVSDRLGFSRITSSLEFRPPTGHPSHQQSKNPTFRSRQLSLLISSPCLKVYLALSNKLHSPRSIILHPSVEPDRFPRGRHGPQQSGRSTFIRLDR